MNVALRTVLLLLVLTLLLVVMVGKKQFTLQTGKPILLETRPVDPRSLFRGDYVRLNYTISTLHPDRLAGDDEFERHAPVYVLLQAGPMYWEPVSIHAGRPVVEDRQVLIKGRVRNVQRQHRDPATRQMLSQPTITVDYGIENYFVPEGEGRELERPPADQRVDLRIVVDVFGNAAIKGVLVNGEERYTERLL